MHKTIRSVDVYYEKYGEGIPIIMIHGFAPDSQLMIGCMEPVFDKESSFSRIYLDLPGMGKTENYDSIQNADHVLTLLLEFIEAVSGRAICTRWRIVWWLFNSRNRSENAR